jgi:hypothetical protein
MLVKTINTVLADYQEDFHKVDWLVNIQRQLSYLISLKAFSLVRYEKPKDDN